MLFLFQKGEKSGAFGKFIFSHAAGCNNHPKFSRIFGIHSKNEIHPQNGLYPKYGITI